MTNMLGILGSSIASVSYLVGFILIAMTQERSKQKHLLLAIFFISFVIYAGILSSTLFLTPVSFIFSFETLRNLVWIFLLLGVVKPKSEKEKAQSESRSLSQSAFLFGAIFLCIFELMFVNIGSHYNWFLVFHIFQSVVVLSLVEQVYRRTESLDKWKIKPLCFGLGLMYTYDIALFSDSLLLQQFNMDFLYGRSWVSLAVVPLILLTARRLEHWSIRVYVSRDVIFHGSLLVICGGYLILMAGAAFAVNYFGYAWNSVLQYLFFVLSCSILMAMFFSEQLRRKLKVFLIKHFYENKYDYRDEWIGFSSNLVNGMKEPFLTSLMSLMRPFDCRHGILYEVKNDRLVGLAKQSVESYDYSARVLRESVYAVEKNWIVELKGSAEATASHKAEADFEYHDQFRYIVPIYSSNGDRYVCLLSKIGNSESFNFEDRDLMNVISRQVSVLIDFHVTQERLTEVHRFSAFHQMSTFLVHDLKNVLAQLELLSKNGAKHKDNPEFIDDAFITIDSASSRLRKVVNHLKKHNLEQSKLVETNLSEVVIEACRERDDNRYNLQCDVALDNTSVISADRDRVKNVFLHLIQNAIDALGGSGWVKVYNRKKEGYFCISVEDNGCGMSESFINQRLFRAFETTKGNAGIGIGAYDAKKLVEELGGYIEVVSQEGIGSRFDVYIPTE